MKTKNLLVLAMTLGLSTQAFASAMTVECSNPQGSIRTTDVMSEQNLILTEYRTGNNELEKHELQLSLRDMKVKELKNTPLFEDSRNNCNDGMAVMSYKLVYHSQVRIEQANGALFSGDISGVTPDRKAIEAFLICERFVSNIMPCESSKK